MGKVLLFLLVASLIISCRKKDEVDLPEDNFISFHFDGVPWVSTSYTAIDSLGYIKIRARGRDNTIFNMTVYKSSNNTFQLVDGYYYDNIDPYKYTTADPNEFETPAFYDPTTFKMQGRFAFIMRYNFDRDRVRPVTFGQYSITYKALGQ